MPAVFVKSHPLRAMVTRIGHASRMSLGRSDKWTARTAAVHLYGLIPGYGAWEDWLNSLPGDDGPMSATRQVVTWTEVVTW